MKEQWPDSRKAGQAIVEIDGFEPTTLCLQSRCSSQLSYTPILVSFLRLLRWPSRPRSVIYGSKLPSSSVGRLVLTKNKLRLSKELFCDYGVGLPILGRSFTEVNSLPRQDALRIAMQR